jgi:hypothetical protein
MTIPESLMMTDSDGTTLVYSNAFVHKSYVLESQPSASVAPVGNADDPAAAAAIFDQADVDGSGDVSREEALAFLLTEGYSVDSEWIDGVWAMTDADGNGLLDADEFPRVIKAAEAHSASKKPAAGDGQRTHKKQSKNQPPSLAEVAAARRSTQATPGQALRSSTPPRRRPPSLATLGRATLASPQLAATKRPAPSLPARSVPTRPLPARSEAARMP